MSATKRPPRQSRAVRTALDATLRELDLGNVDKAGASLARRLAIAIDQETSGRTVAELGRAMLAVLESLGATPAARKALAKETARGGGPNVGGGESALDRARKRRAARQHGAAAVDASTS